MAISPLHGPGRQAAAAWRQREASDSEFVHFLIIIIWRSDILFLSERRSKSSSRSQQQYLRNNHWHDTFEKKKRQPR